MRALVEQKLKPQYLLKANDLFEVIRKYVRTNYSTRDLIKHLGIVKNIKSEDVQMYQLPNYTQTIGGGSYVICKEDELNELVQTVFMPRADEAAAENATAGE